MWLTLNCADIECRGDDRVTVLLTVAANGTKLPPMVVFKGKVDGRIASNELARAVVNGYPSGMIYAVNPTAYTDTAIAMAWLNAVGMH